MKEKLLYGTKVNEPEYMEQLLSTQPENFDKVIVLAKRDGFDRFRISTVDLSVIPDFTKTLNI